MRDRDRDGKDMTEAQEQRVFVTGGASGLGKAIAMRFAKAGFKVCIGDLNVERGAEAEQALKLLSPDAFFVRCDVTDEQALEGVKEALSKRWGGVDVVVNNAGVAGTFGPIEDVSLDDWKWVFDVNLFGIVRGLKAFTPQFKAQGSGHFVNIASAAGLITAPMMSNYNAVKSSVVSLSETMAVELHASNINTTVVCPAFFETNLTESLNSEVKGVDMGGKVDRMMSRSTITAEDIADSIYKAVLNNEFWVVPHKSERRMWQLKRWFPNIFRKLLISKTKGLAAAVQ